ncbi:MAG: hypothetical protein LAT76_00210 [Schleiferiaceae bacterium]|nr:hypothetical protein [Schleiferiaceae bacterium]
MSDNNNIINKKFKVKLDSRTIITLSNEASLAFWKTKYPNLKILPATS